MDEGTTVKVYGGKNFGLQGASITGVGNLTFSSANPTISASSYFVAPGGAYFSSGTVYTEAAIQARGGISNDSGNCGGNVCINESMTVSGSTTASSFVYTSDRRLKENVIPIASALEKINALKGIHFTWKKDGKPDYGFIAQEVEKAEPDLVVTSEDKDKTKAVKYGNITAILVEAIKELWTKFDSSVKLQDQSMVNLKVSLENHERKISNLEKRVSALEESSQAPSRIPAGK
jgi:hypothetical protein